jgi:hypothetical protein
MDPELRYEINSSISEGRSGVPSSEETIEKLRKALTGRIFTEEHKDKISESLTGRTLSEEHCRKLSERVFTKEWKENLSIGQKLYWRSEEGKLNRQTIVSEGKNIPVIADFNEVEKLADSILQNCFPGYFYFSGNTDLRVGSKCPDFSSLKNSKKVIEVFGSYYHSAPDEESLKLYYKELGFDLLVIWDWQLKDASISLEKFSLLLTRISDFITKEN